jgi:hypothetical protein
MMDDLQKAKWLIEAMERSEKGRRVICLSVIVSDDGFIIEYGQWKPTFTEALDSVCAWYKDFFLDRIVRLGEAQKQIDDDKSALAAFTERM